MPRGRLARRVALAACLAGAAAPAAAQQLGPSTGGLEAIEQARRFVGQHKRVLMIAAHPDDENTELLAVLARGWGAEAAYLSLSRGEGGQNLIGAELGPALGVLRSEELLAARRLDGARQYFTRAYDFGFSKTLADTWRFWPADSVLKDVVRVVRAFRPQVVVSIFAGTPQDGHGQHQAAGWAAREAFSAAADPARFPELEQELGLRPWAPAKLYQSARFDTAGAGLVLEGGELDRAVGQSFTQIAMRSRSLHRSQDMGAAQRLGPSPIRLRLVEDRTGAGSAAPMFAGVDTSFAAALGLAGLAAAEANAVQRVLLAAAGTPAMRPDLVLARDRIERALASRPGPEMRDQLRRVDEFLFRTSEVLCDATTATPRAVPGRRLPVVLQCWNASPRPVRVQMALLGGVLGNPATARDHALAPGGLVADTLDVVVPEGTQPTRPYYLELAPDGALYRWPDRERTLGGLPFGPPVLEAAFALSTGGTAVMEVVHRAVDQAVGEVRRPLAAVPRVAATLDPGTALWPAGAPVARRFTVTLHHYGPDTTEVTARLEAPEGWRVSPPQPVRFVREGEERRIQFTVTPAPRAGGRHVVQLHLDGPGADGPAVGVSTVEYPHIRPRQLVTAAASVLVVAPLARPAAPGRIAYVRGAADRVPEALEAMGVPVTLLTGDSLAATPLARFATVVIGPRAYESDPALARHSGRLLDYARRGGTVIVQYQQQPYFLGGFAPYLLSLTERPGAAPVRVSAPRVAEEDAAVTLLEPAHPVFRGPNRIGPGDWEGWVQERGLYFARAWGPEWTPLLEAADEGEAPQRGGLLVGRVGTGWYVYTGLSFFRQLPAAVPGAARLFLNLLALGRPVAR